MAYSQSFTRTDLSTTEKDNLWTDLNAALFDEIGDLEGTDAEKKVQFYSQFTRLLAKNNAFIWRYMRDGVTIGARMVVEPTRDSFDIPADLVLSFGWDATDKTRQLSHTGKMICENPNLIALDADYASDTMVSTHFLMSEESNSHIFDEDATFTTAAFIEELHVYLQSIGKTKTFNHTTGNTAKAFVKSKADAESHVSVRYFGYNQIQGAGMVSLGITNEYKHTASLTTTGMGWTV